ncbi:hypothetical protein DFR24_2904 [Panacagrimonas perspica]|uniref:DUF2235 domain-containing protein n=1 Tax=Panacagrimonas perspica TaxID=381431 RepID=A0A4R7P4Z7_9GAMM|nr:hypothetical protein [Panacagrimonas perspica]TDU28532.1 hypothetical protein DFR24_2904 [Panacagrimonas perspica]
MSRVFTVYNCGTGFNRTQTDEVVANMASRTSGAENRDWMVTDGVGQAFNTPGTFDPITGKKNVLGHMDERAILVALGSISGWGWEQNERHVWAVISSLISGSSAAPDTINMVGWSRGAITCHMIAHALAKTPQTRHLKVNIFAFDPVPGPGNFKPDKITLATNIHDYSVVQMDNEQRWIMRPMSFDGISESDVHGKYNYHVLPGQHDTGVMRARGAVGMIGAGLAHAFMTRHGTSLRSPLSYTPKEYCNLYAVARLNILKYKKAPTNNRAQQLGGLATHRRGLAPVSTVPKKLVETEYFVNNHHAHMFRKAFPNVYMRLQAGATLTGMASQTLKAAAHMTHTSLVEAGLAA